MTEKANQTKLTINRQYKARIFEMLYEDKKELLDLYNAINETDYQDPNLLEINTLKNAIYMSMHNDVSFVIGSIVSLYEHTIRVRDYARTMSIELAVDKAIDECIKEGILADFLSRNKAEAKKVSIYEYDEEKHMRMEREASFEDGLTQGRQEMLLELIEKKLAKGKSLAQIAEELEEDFSVIQELVKDNAQ